ncbi:hypothetical protein C8039_02690 [Halogeometricum sp. wsp3]|nr:hypothetical protein C8039_02690 [Halogeometricum sp. wsp3]
MPEKPDSIEHISRSSLTARTRMRTVRHLVTRVTTSDSHPEIRPRRHCQQDDSIRLGVRLAGTVSRLYPMSAQRQSNWQ